VRVYHLQESITNPDGNLVRYWLSSVPGNDTAWEAVIERPPAGIGSRIHPGAIVWRSRMGSMADAKNAGDLRFQSFKTGSAGNGYPGLIILIVVGAGLVLAGGMK